MSDDEDPGYLPIKPGDRVLIEYDDPGLTRSFGGPGTVASVVNAWTAKIKRDADAEARTYMRWLLVAVPAQEAKPWTIVQTKPEG